MIGSRRSDRYTQEVFSDLEEDEQALVEAMRGRAITRPPNRIIMTQGEIGDGLYVVNDGWAIRYCETGGNQRQIVDFLLPGEIIGLEASLLGVMQHSVRSLTSVQLSVFDPRLVAEAFGRAPRLALRFAQHAAAEASRVEEMMTVIGCCEAIQRIAFLMLSLYHRQGLKRAVDPHDCPFPLRRQHLAEALGLTGAHVNRMLNRLKQEGLALLQGRRLAILDMQGLQRVSGETSGVTAPVGGNAPPP